MGMVSSMDKTRNLGWSIRDRDMYLLGVLKSSELALQGDRADAPLFSLE